MRRSPYVRRITKLRRGRESNIACMGEQKYTKGFIRTFGRPNRRGVDIVKMDLETVEGESVDWILNRDVDQWRTVTKRRIF